MSTVGQRARIILVFAIVIAVVVGVFALRRGRAPSSVPSAAAANTGVAAVPPGSTATAPPAPLSTVAATDQSSSASPLQPTSSQPPLKMTHPAVGALTAPQPDMDYSEFIGPSTIDDGMSMGTSANVGQPAAKAVSSAADAFNLNDTPAAPAEPDVVRRARAIDGRIPQSEYSLDALAQTLPNDPVAIYQFVRDHIAIDPYDGIMRGPLGAWLSRAGSPSDQLTVLATLLIKKKIPLQFVRGTLSNDERARIASAAVLPAGAPAPVSEPARRAEPTLNAYLQGGTSFATWAGQQLAAAKVPLGGSAPSVNARHYWIQVDRGGRTLDLDPTLKDMTEGSHLATIDPSFRPWAMLPNDEWHYIQIRVTQRCLDGTEQKVFEFTGKTDDIAYAPLRLAFVPQGKSDFKVSSTARAFSVMFTNGAKVLPTTTVDMDVHGGTDRIWIDVRRSDVSGHIQTSSRDLVASGTPRAEQGADLGGMASILVVPGSGANLFALHEYVMSIGALEGAIAKAQGGEMTPGPVYPLAELDYFSRDDAVAARLEPSLNGRLYRDRPNIALERATFPVKNGVASPTLTFDIIENGMAVIGANRSRAAAANLSRGYADTQIEQDVIRAGNANGTIALFDAATRAGVTSTVITTPGAIAPSVRPLARGLDNTLGSGHVAIAPITVVQLSGASAFGWWDVDPASGNVVGRMSGGAGQAQVEYPLLFKMISLQWFEIHALLAVKDCVEDTHACVVGLCEAGVSGAFLLGGLTNVPKAVVEAGSAGPLIAAVAVAVVAELFVQILVCSS